MDCPRLILPAAAHAGGGPSLKLRFIKSSMRLPEKKELIIHSQDAEKSAIETRRVKPHRSTSV